jgi:hypothetical protein
MAGPIPARDEEHSNALVGWLVRYRKFLKIGLMLLGLVAVGTIVAVVVMITKQDDPVTVTLPSYCSHSPDMTCYESGWPSCCTDESFACPDVPYCNIDTVATTSSTPALPGSSYCTYSPDYFCYVSGWPSCCTDESIFCLDKEPSCEIDYVPVSSAVLVLSTLSFVSAVIAMTVSAFMN